MRRKIRLLGRFGDERRLAARRGGTRPRGPRWSGDSSEKNGKIRNEWRRGGAAVEDHKGHSHGRGCSYAPLFRPRGAHLSSRSLTPDTYCPAARPRVASIHRLLDGIQGGRSRKELPG